MKTIPNSSWPNPTNSCQHSFPAPFNLEQADDSLLTPNKAPLAQEEDMSIEDFSIQEKPQTKTIQAVKSGTLNLTLTTPTGKLNRHATQVLIERLSQHLGNKGSCMDSNSSFPEDLQALMLSELNNLSLLISQQSEAQLNLNEALTISQKFEELKWLAKDSPPYVLIKRLATQFFTSWLILAKQVDEQLLLNALAVFQTAEISDANTHKSTAKLGVDLAGANIGGLSISMHSAEKLKSHADQSIESSQGYSIEVEQRLGLKSKCLSLFAALFQKAEYKTSNTYSSLAAYVKNSGLYSGAMLDVSSFKMDASTAKYFQHHFLKGVSNEYPLKELLAEHLAINPALKNI